MVGRDNYRPRARNMSKALNFRAEEQHQERRKKGSQYAVWQVVHGVNLAPNHLNVRI